VNLPEKVDLSLAVPAQGGAPEQERRAAAVPAREAAQEMAEHAREDRTSRPAWSLRAIFRNHPFPPVPGMRTSSLTQDEEATR
jgi:hypothetical protein